jgi:D-aminopeptidase
MLPNYQLSGLFTAAVECTEEAIINSLTMANTMAGLVGRYVPAIPLTRLVDLVARYGRLEGSGFCLLLVPELNC